jgi:heme A synthase
MKSKKIKLVSGIIFLLIVVIMQAYLRITNIDMSEFRLLISYPLHHILSIVWLVVAYYLINKGCR